MSGVASSALCIVRFDSDLAARVNALFREASCPCHCRYWHFEGDKNAWLERCAAAPETNARELEDAARAESPEADALVALDAEGRAVGWLKLAPRSTLTKLSRLNVYRGRALGSADGVLVIGCMLVHPEHRRAGIARSLVAAAIVEAMSRGAQFLEAYPRRSDAELSPEQAWMGPHAVYVDLGFEIVPHPEEESGATTYPYPVLRRRIAGSPP